MKFYGTHSDLKDIVAGLGIPGTWSGTNPHEYILIDKSAKLRWWPSTGTIFIDGKQAERDAFREIVSAVIPSVAAALKANAPKGPAHEE
ncbi:hypothetical protein [Afipia clevelandensis]|uniref:Uncharacterized protein n=1 Tax=Afipia clevelandensis ATCC 49720 TaxID=883079 RepID=K8NW01_9BRAD|nr:hypothetical protein [Afipia clevelandensis]EKS32669.1 hypothetical protein HMPREF9696_03646 [Afipia clevelandensis ATCC 49720]